MKIKCRKGSSLFSSPPRKHSLQRSDGPLVFPSPDLYDHDLRMKGVDLCWRTMKKYSQIVSSFCGKIAIRDAVPRGPMRLREACGIRGAAQGARASGRRSRGGLEYGNQMDLPLG